ncbi:hypothetical protein T01_13173 [Trichinella spiralis]|uniref:Uncharacterized protein n=1 Tax=Trichinella spiralis TaxID=6334 RepID=A0A0V1BPG3_TRISP|nr:hypothetical protein T01_13173 [Trichinella spiralis]
MPFNRPNRETTICSTIDRPALAKGHLRSDRTCLNRRPWASKFYDDDDDYTFLQDHWRFYHSIQSVLFPDRRRWCCYRNGMREFGTCRSSCSTQADLDHKAAVEQLLDQKQLNNPIDRPLTNNNTGAAHACSIIYNSSS